MDYKEERMGLIKAGLGAATLVGAQADSMKAAAEDFNCQSRWTDQNIERGMNYGII